MRSPDETSRSTHDSPVIHWDDHDIVLLDMDGTLLDLQFDNYFWLELVPARYAQANRLTLESARELLKPRFAAEQGSLNWYCTDFWTRELALDIADMKREIRERVQFLPGAEDFLRFLEQRGMRTVLVTNAHPDSLEVKVGQTQLGRYFQTIVTSHRYGAPKEQQAFWRKLQEELQFDPARALFIDDSLAVLRAAREFGIATILAVARPDTTRDARKIAEFAAIDGVAQLVPSQRL